MNFSCITALVLGALLLTSAPALAQSSGPDVKDQAVVPASVEEFNPYAAVYEPEEGEDVVPNIESPSLLFELLTAPGVCPVGSTQARRIPCALVADGELRPIFKIESRDKIWTLVKGKLALVTVGDLWHVRKFDEPFDPYNPQRTTEVLGYEQNKKNCALGMNCVPEVRYTAFGSGRVLTSQCVTLIWDTTPARCRFWESSRK